MASTIGMVGRTAQPDEVLNSLKRSGFSLRFNTRRVRHWIMVQLVSVPMQTMDEQEIASAQQMQFSGSRTNVARLVDDYMLTQFVRRWV